jgi:CHAT domain-containing protein/tetratricopeptide (TPR) repeat protein
VKTCPPPDGSLLPPSHQPFLSGLFQILGENEFRNSRLDPLLPGIVANFTQLCTSEDDLGAWYDELSRWVRWYRLPAYWLTFIFQLVTKALNSPFHILACELYSDAQTLFADDLALSSLETAYISYSQNRTILGKAFESVGSHLQAKLRHYYDYYNHWSRPFEYVECNPCASHLYNSLSRSWLVGNVREQERDFDIENAEGLSGVISQCNTDDVAFYRILARRFLGLLYDSQGRYELSVKQYELALAEARRLKLDTEIGHLRRLLGWALRAMGKGEESRHHFEQALAYERLGVVFAYTAYWQALSARELGDTITRFAGPIANAAPGGPGRTPVAIADPEKLRPALHAYHDGRMHFSSHLSIQSPFPVARAAKQQLFRSFSANAIQVACTLQSTNDMLAEVELSGPRQATEVVTEIAAARENGQTPLAEFRRTRAVYYKTLSTMPSEFDEYVANLAQYNVDRRTYLQESFALDKTLMGTQWCDKIVERALALRLPDTVFLFFHVGVRTSTMVLMDMSSGVAAPFHAPFGEDSLRSIHEEYERSVQDVTKRESALDKLLLSYASIFGPLLEPILPFLPGRHLKIFPRLQMNAVPWHALRVKDKYLLEHCATISYGQTIGLFLENHSNKTTQHSTALRVVVGDKVLLYDLILPKIREVYAGASCEERPTSWPQLMASISAQPASDTLFACHGNYEADNLDGSQLELSGGTTASHIRFSQVFAELDLRGCRSVIMGACESGLARAGIGAEYIGLPSAMLASGVQYVIGALWTIPQLATAILMVRYLELLKDESIGVCAALCRVQREVMMMTRDELSKWFRNLIASHPDLDAVLQEVAGMDEHPFAHPYHWAGLQVVGDV